MTAHTFEVDDLTPIQRKSSGVRISGETLLTYDVTVIAADVESVVGAAGGWLCDRVRAGWQVAVLVPEGCDVRALTILGVRTGVWESGVDTLRRLRPAAVAVDASILAHDDSLRREVLRTVDRVRHRLSAAARAFKASALLSSGGAGSDQAVEEFVGAALWYLPDGTDLIPIPAGQ